MAASTGTLTIAPYVARPDATEHPVPPAGPAPAAGFGVAEGGGSAPATQRRRVSKQRRQALRRSRGRTFSTDPDDPQPRLPFRDANAGAAVWQKVIRWLVALFVVLFAVVGIVRTLRPAETVTRADIVGVLNEEFDRTGFPVERGQAFAAHFLQVYFTWSADLSQDRATQLRSFLPEGLPDGWDGQGAQKVMTTPILADAIEEIDQHRANYTMAFMLDNGQWLNSRVQVYADDDGNLVAASLPALVPPPAIPDFPGNEVFAQVDPDVSETLGSMLPGFFEAWAASDSVGLDRYITTDASEPTRRGLEGAVSLSEVDDIQAELPADPQATTRRATATVTWKTGEGGASYSQTYLVTVVQVDDRWYVRDITVGLPSLGEQSASTAEPSSTQSGGPVGSSAPPSPSGG